MMYFPGSARVRRELRRRKLMPGLLTLSFWFLCSAVCRLSRLVMGVCYARDDEESADSGHGKMVFDGDEDDFAEWAFRMEAYLDELDGRVWELAFAPEPPSSFNLTATMDDLEARARAQGTWVGIGDPAARTAWCRTEATSAIDEARKLHKLWVRAQKKMYNKLVLKTTGKANRLVRTVTNQSGKDAWGLLQSEFGRRLSGDRQLLARVRAVRSRLISRA